MQMQPQEPYQWWRWPLMPVAALGGAILGSIIMGIIMWLGMKFQGGFNEDGWYFLYIMPLFTSGVFGYLYAIISYKMAPSHNLIAGIVMVTVLGVIGLLGIVLAWALPEYSVGQSVQATVGTVATMVGAIIALADPN